MTFKHILHCSAAVVQDFPLRSRLAGAGLLHQDATEFDQSPLTANFAHGLGWVKAIKKYISTLYIHINICDMFTMYP